MVSTKIIKKRNQSYHTYHKLNGITSSDSTWPLFSSEPTNYLCLTNLGYGGVGGITPQQLLEIIEKDFEIKQPFELLCRNGKPFSYLIFSDTKYSAIAHDKLHLGQIEYLNNKIIFCEYLKNIPSSWLNSENSIKVPGLELIENFLTIEEEKQILESILNDQLEWSKVQNRHVKHFGYIFDYKTNSFGHSTFSIPEWAINLLLKLSEFTNDTQIKDMDQMTVSQYPVGSGIPPHVDAHTPFGPSIISVSLSSSTQMEFYNPATRAKHSVTLPPRSIMIMSGEARYGWEHCIKERKSDIDTDGQLIPRKERISLTFRTTNPDLNCQCNFQYLCNRKNNSS